MMIKIISLIFFFMANANAFTNDSYYAGRLEGDLSGIKEKLWQIVSSLHLKGNPDQLVDYCDKEEDPDCYGHTNNSYRTSRKQLYWEIDLQYDHESPYIHDAYCLQDFVGEDISPSATTLNCEHAWPQMNFSLYFNKSLQKADMHHLFLTLYEANNKRGHLPLGEVKDKVHLICNTSKIGELDGVEYFEPPNESKGDIARAFFYFSIRYKMPIDPIQEKFMRKWHELDPVSDRERERHERIFSFQQNRNPFIDFPFLVNLIEDF